MPAPPPIPLGVPSGWYCLGFTDELPVGAVLERRIAGRELVLFRTRSGVPAVFDAWCPHLGANLSVGGTVVDETLRCPFHGFRFEVDGRCAFTPYGKKVPPTATAQRWPLVEVNGLLMCWFGAAGEPPSFAIHEVDRTAWTAWRHHRFELRGHPQEIAENSVDVGHLAEVHGYRSVTAQAPLRTEGALLSARYAFERPRRLLGRSTIEAEIEIAQWGLGYALVEVSIGSFGLRTRQLVLSLPVAQDRLHLRIGMAVREVAEPGRIHPLLGWFPATKWLAERIADASIREYVGDVAQDVGIWETKAWLPRPALADGDGPIGAYRRWTKQFYPVGDAPC